MSLRAIVVLNVAFLLAAPPLFVALRRRRGGMPAWKRPFAAGIYLTVLAATVVEVTDATPVASSPRLALALDALAALAAVVGIALVGRSWRVRRRSGDPAPAE
ncbi:hypothetical protein [Halosimplex marinum]|uniref:hypothetical protein n=1 Tax=Halosimplex marinum TaxID=3396620 RepID=UPI003F54B5EB